MSSSTNEYYLLLTTTIVVFLLAIIILPFLKLVSAFTGPLAHRALAKTSNAANLMAFSIGSSRFIISSHPDTAKEILGSSSTCERVGLRASLSPRYGVRSIRRLLEKLEEDFSHPFVRVARFGGFRKEMVREIEGLMSENGVVEVKKVLHFGSLNNVMMSVFGKSYEFGDGEKLQGLVREGYELLGVFNWSDHFPLLGRFDLQGVRKRCKALVDVLLDFDGEDKLSDGDMIAVLWEMIFRGTDTVAILLEWVLARMVIHPDTQAKAQAEIDSVIGSTTRDVEDSDLLELPYLSAIIKETLRMHPPGPLLSWARLSTEDTHVGPHFVPAGTTAMVNMWSITHDPSVRDDPEEFSPERFIEKDVAIMGSDLRLAPFGAGRRVCPGKAMGLVTLQLWLAHLLHKFKWVEGESGVSLSEVLNLSLEMKNSLVWKAIPSNRVITL